MQNQNNLGSLKFKGCLGKKFYKFYKFNYISIVCCKAVILKAGHCHLEMWQSWNLALGGSSLESGGAQLALSSPAPWKSWEDRKRDGSDGNGMLWILSLLFQAYSSPLFRFIPLQS